MTKNGQPENALQRAGVGGNRHALVLSSHFRAGSLKPVVCKATRVCYVSALKLMDFEMKGVEKD